RLADRRAHRRHVHDRGDRRRRARQPQRPDDGAGPAGPRPDARAQSVTGGYNYVNPTGVGNGGWLLVELQWDANPEGSVTGYEVDRSGFVWCGGQTSLTTSCIDLFPAGSGSTTYTIKTWYRDASNAYQSVSTPYTVTAPGLPVP